MKRNKIVLPMLLVLMLLLSACGGGVIDQAANKLTEVLSWGRDYYSRGVAQEKNITTLFRQYEQSMSTFRLGARDLITNNANCFKDVAATESAIADAALGNQDEGALVNALSTDSVTGEQATSGCVEGNRQIADYVLTNRQAVQDNYMATFSAAEDYMEYTSSFPEIDVMNDLLQTYGDMNTLRKELKAQGIEVVGATDFTWLPTANLWVSTTDKALCDYYTTGAFVNELMPTMKSKFENHPDALMGLYESAWDSSLGECRLTRYAALKFMTRKVVSRDTNQIINTGVDEGIFVTEQPR